MSRAYVLCSQHFIPAYLTSPKVVAVYESLKEAKAEVKRRNESKLTRNAYWVESVPRISSSGGNES